MAPWTSLALLSVLAVSALSFPDESAYKIPSVGTGRRSQYYVLHDDGTYKYGHDTGEGAYETARLHHAGRLDGKFGYQDPDGNHVSLSYEAGHGGFRPVGSHIPEAHPDFYAAHAEAQARPPFVDPLADSNTDASYDFNYAEGGSARQETSDADGNVRGSYSYTDEDGQTRSYSYTAGRGTGFVVEGDDLPQAPLAPGATPAATSLRAGGSSSVYRGSSSGTSSFRPSTSAHSTSTGFTPTSSSSRLPARPFTASTRSGSGAGFTSSTDTRPDGSYSFTYDAGDHSRSETGDANLNVDGQFSFVADDGVRRTVNYEAGSDTGFLASGDHLPQAPQPTHSTRGSSFSSTRASTGHGSRPSTGHSSRTPTSYSTSSGSGLTGASHSTFGSGFASTRQSGPVETANTRSQLNPDGSYAFAYKTSDHSRAETGDANVNVDGNFDFVADDGQRRAIQYEAGSDTGFIAEGAHIPVGPSVPGAPSGQPTGRIVPVQEVLFIDPLANSNADASYNFAFDSEQHSRSETADADGNVQGTYTVVDDDGTRRTIQYRAGQGIGFETNEVSSSRGPVPSGAASRASSFSSSGASSTHGGSGASSSFGTGTGSRHSSATTYTAPSTSQSHSSFSHGSRGAGTQTSYDDNFQLTQYGAEGKHGKYGYVLTFDS